MKTLFKLAIAVLTLVILSGCATEKIVYVPKEVKIMVPVAAPQPPTFDVPAMPIADLNDSSTPDVVIKAYVATVQLLKDMVKERDRALNIYRKPVQGATK